MQDRMRKTSDSGERKYTRGKMTGTNVQRDTMTAEKKEREDRLSRSYISLSTLNTLICKPHSRNIFFSKSTVSREGKLHRKAATETQREETEEIRSQKKHFLLPDSLPPRLRLSVSAVCAEGIPLWQNMDLSLTPLSASQSCYY